MPRRRALRRRCFALTASILIAAGAQADHAHLNVDESGLALRGYDPVAYFVTGRAVKGSAFHETSYDGAEYRFSSKANLEKFLTRPDRYLPAYGGYCSYGVRVGKKFDGDPTVWQVVDDRLYLQLDQGTQRIWAKETRKNIAIANRLWPNIRAVPAAELQN